MNMLARMSHGVKDRKKVYELTNKGRKFVENYRLRAKYFKVAQPLYNTGMTNMDLIEETMLDSYLLKQILEELKRQGMVEINER